MTSQIISHGLCNSSRSSCLESQFYDFQAKIEHSTTTEPKQTLLYLSNYAISNQTVNSSSFFVLQIFRAPHEIRSSSPCTGTRCLCKGTSQIFTRISLLPKLMAEAWLKHKLQVPSYMSCQNLKHETESTLAPRVEIYFEFFVASSCSWTTANPWKKCNSLSNQSLSEFIALNHIQNIEHMSVKEKMCLSLLVMQVREC